MAITQIDITTTNYTDDFLIGLLKQMAFEDVLLVKTSNGTIIEIAVGEYEGDTYDTDETYEMTEFETGQFENYSYNNYKELTRLLRLEGEEKYVINELYR